MFGISPRRAAVLVVAILSTTVAFAAPVSNAPGSPPKPTSYAPHHSASHVYGTPIDPPAVRRGKSRHHVQPAKKAPERPTLGTLNMTPRLTTR
jgi:hypothetical protein